MECRGRGRGFGPPAGRCSSWPAPFWSRRGGWGGPLPPAMTIPYVGLSDSRSRLLPVQPAAAQGAAGLGSRGQARLAEALLPEKCPPPRHGISAGWASGRGLGGWGARAQEGLRDPHPGLWLAPVRAAAPEHWSWGVGQPLLRSILGGGSWCQDPTPALAGLQQWARASGQGVFLGKNLRGGSAQPPLPWALSELKAWAGGPWGF